jgi:hypothetical protein
MVKEKRSRLMSMKKAFAVLFSITIFGLMVGNPAWSAGALKVTTPNGGELWTKGKTYTIKWKTGNGGSRVKIELLKSGKVYKTIKKRTKNDGKFRWEIPSSEKTSTSYRIRITSASKDNVSDSSNKVFSIKKKSTGTSSTGLKVTSPNGGESWRQESTYTIKWDKTGGAKSIKIELYENDELSITIASDTDNDGSYSWEIPTSVLVGSKYQVRIQSIHPDASQSDLSNRNFSVRKRRAGLKSSAFRNGGIIPKKYTCDGIDSSPPLTISGIPDGTKELVLFLDDLDGTPTATNTTTDWNHWVVYRIPVVSSISPGYLPSGVLIGRNDAGDDAYNGPCPPAEGSNRMKHSYRFKLYAIDTKLSIGPGATRSEIVTAMEGNILKGFTLTGNYGEY